MRDLNKRPSLDSMSSSETLLECKESAREDEGRYKTQKHPIDGGKDAWLFMIGAFLVDAVLWGLPLNFGIFQSYYTTHAPFSGNQYIPMVGTFAIGISYIGGFIMIPITSCYAHYRQQLTCLGVVFCVFGALGASFATATWQLILFQGVIYGLGLLIVSYVIFSQLNEWFVRKRGLAYGIQLSASGLGGIFLPFVLQTLLERYGCAITLRLYAFTIIAFVGPPIFLLRSRPKVQPEYISRPSKMNYAVYKRPTFYVLASANVLQSVAFYIPIFYLPTIATAMNITLAQIPILLALLNVSQILGLLSFGFVSDCLNPYLLSIISTAISSMAVFVLLASGTSFSLLAVFALTYGFFGGGFEALFPRFVSTLTRDARGELALYAIFEGGSGLGVLLAGPISSWLISADAGTTAGEEYDERNFGGLLVFVGVVLGVAGLGGAGWFLRGDVRDDGGKGGYAVVDGEVKEEEKELC